MSLLGIAVVVSAASVALAALALARTRAIAADRARLRSQLAELLQRLEGAEKSASAANARSTASLNLLLDKGVADEEDVAAAADRRDDGERGPDTIH